MEMNVTVCESVINPNVTLTAMFSLECISVRWLAPSPSPGPALWAITGWSHAERTVVGRLCRTRDVSSRCPPAAARLPGFASLCGGKGEKQRLPKGSWRRQGKRG